jgi:hypothetical protein
VNEPLPVPPEHTKTLISREQLEEIDQPETFNIPEETDEILSTVDTPSVGRCSRQHKPTQRLKESWEQGGLSFASVINDPKRDAESQIQDDISHPISFAASADPDIMYMEQAIRQPDKK